MDSSTAPDLLDVIKPPSPADAPPAADPGRDEPIPPQRDPSQPLPDIREDLNFNAPGAPWFTLACIVGNEEHHIGRFLAAFEPLVDEIVLVRAIGSLVPDETIAIAREQVRKPLRIGEYHNAANLAHWPHVDNFAKARQAAWDLARGKFIMWADCDDIIDSDTIAKLRAEVDLGLFDVLFMHYRIAGKPPLMRERVIRRSLNCPWVQPVHEALSLPPPGKFIGRPRPDLEVFHLPLPDKQKSNKAIKSLSRNLRILENAIEPAAMIYFYLHRDSLLLAKPNEAIKWGVMAAKAENLTPAEKYAVYYNLAKLYLDVGDFGQCENMCLNGLRLAPYRRECYCIMSLSYNARKDWTRALTWIQLAKCINMPPVNERPNWIEDSWYGWQANLTNAFICRKLKAPDAALKIEDEEHGGAPMISLLHATRGRPEKALATRDQWLRAALKPGMIEHIFAIDADDKESVEELDGCNVVTVEPGGGCVRAWNAAAALSRGKVLVQMSDDWVVPHHWDNLIIWRMQEAIEKNRPAVLAISDGHRTDKLLCMAILTRQYYLRQKHERTGDPYLFHPDYLGVYSDNEFTVRAYENGVVIDGRDLTFVHDHPIFAGKPLDATYAAQNAADRYEQGKAIFNRRNPRYKIE